MSRLYSGQLGSGGDYGELKPVIGIHFLDYYEFPEHDDFRFCFELRDFRYPGLRLTDDIALYIFERRKFEKKRKAGMISADSLGDWLSFFNHAREEGDSTMRTHYQNPSVHKAFDVLETLSADEKMRRLAGMREKALKNEASALAAAKREGKEEKARMTAKKLLKMGVLTLEQIMEATGLTLREVAEIQKND